MFPWILCLSFIAAIAYAQDGILFPDQLESRLRQTGGGVNRYNNRPNFAGQYDTPLASGGFRPAEHQQLLPPEYSRHPCYYNRHTNTPCSPVNDFSVNPNKNNGYYPNYPQQNGGASSASSAASATSGIVNGVPVAASSAAAAAASSGPQRGYGNGADSTASASASSSSSGNYGGYGNPPNNPWFRTRIGDTDTEDDTKTENITVTADKNDEIIINDN